MPLDTQAVQKIARLACLELGGEDTRTYAETLSRILDLIEQMRAVDTSGVAPMAHPHEAGLRLRPDQVTETDRRAKFMNIAPASEAGLYLVPKVIE